MEENEFIPVENLALNIPHIIGSADIFMWRFYNAPEELQKLSLNGGDEDWLVIVKAEFYNNKYIPFLDEGVNGSIGRCDIQKFIINDYVMLIGSHA